MKRKDNKKNLFVITRSAISSISFVDTVVGCDLFVLYFRVWYLLEHLVQSDSVLDLSDLVSDDTVEHSEHEAEPVQIQKVHSQKDNGKEFDGKSIAIDVCSWNIKLANPITLHCKKQIYSVTSV